MYYSADIGVIGGSGFYKLTDLDARRVVIDTPYGKPSDTFSIINYKNQKIAFLPRHGKDHTLAPAEINYLANIDAFAQLGVKAMILPCCVGSLREDFKPGDYVVTDQYINFTSGRKDTFYSSPQVVSVSAADPYDASMRKMALEAGRKLGFTMHDGGTIGVINGPRFSTRAESKMFKMLGADIVNMTQYPEAYLCQEKGIPVVNIALVTDYDAGLEGNPGIKPVTSEAIKEMLDKNVDNMRQLITVMVECLGAK